MELIQIGIFFCLLYLCHVQRKQSQAVNLMLRDLLIATVINLKTESPDDVLVPKKEWIDYLRRTYL